MAKIEAIEGIGDVYGAKLRALGIQTTDQLLEQAATRKGRQELAEPLDVSEKLVLAWANRADLFRIKGIGKEYSDLLEAAGVDTVPELAQRNPENLHQKLLEVNAEKRLVRRSPSLNQVRIWVAQAKELPRVLSY
ncbi:MAG TPA: DUF4332 domain-containing protein [Anaerolineae bacterium]|nr:DUF4332 domain-containing protein [Caldilineae bacterium]HID33561.1 DUF4332 domain-containing protein [Anaerolineae bacterium]